MKKSLPIIVLFMHLFNSASAQDFYFLKQLATFEQASAFDISPSGFIVVADKFRNEITKFDTNGTRIVSIGGFGWDEGAFDLPIDIFFNSLSVYVCDYNNHRIQRFDKDLNFISQLSTRDSENSEERFGYPMACVTSNIGDLFILDSENKRILKFDLFGNFIQQFGGYEAGNFALNAPQKIAATPDNKLYVIDEDRLLLFDQYGNGIADFATEQNFTSIKIIFSSLVLSNDGNIFLADLKSNTFGYSLVLKGYKFEDKIISSILLYDKLYVLTEKSLLVFIQ